MSTRATLILLLTGAVCVPAMVSTSPAAGPAGPARRPNFLFILTDDQGYGDLSCHGNPILRTPYLDTLHDESVPQMTRYLRAAGAGP